VIDHWLLLAFSFSLFHFNNSGCYGEFISTSLSGSFCLAYFRRIVERKTDYAGFWHVYQRPQCCCAWSCSITTRRRLRNPVSVNPSSPHRSHQFVTARVAV